MLRYLKKTKGLRTLHFSKNKLIDCGGVIIAEAVSSNRSLYYLDLESNGVGNKAATALATALQNNETLEKLDLRQNEIANIGENQCIHDRHYHHHSYPRRHLFRGDAEGEQ